MKKWLIIDGYNLLYSPSFIDKSAAKSLEERRDQIIREVAELGYLMAEKLTIVFDGRSSVKTSITNDKSLEIMFAPPELTADAFIIRLVGKCNFPEEVTVVSSDKIVVENVTSLGAEAISTNFFCEWMANARQNLSARLSRQSIRRTSFTLGEILSDRFTRNGHKKSENG